MSMELELRSHEVAQLEEMLPYAREMYEMQEYDDGIETIETIQDSLGPVTDIEPEDWKTLMLAVSSQHVRENAGGMGVSREWWLTRKIAKRLDEKDAFQDNEDGE